MNKNEIATRSETLWEAFNFFEKHHKECTPYAGNETIADDIRMMAKEWITFEKSGVYITPEWINGRIRELFRHVKPPYYKFVKKDRFYTALNFYNYYKRVHPYRNPIVNDDAVVRNTIQYMANEYLRDQLNLNPKFSSDYYTYLWNEFDKMFDGKEKNFDQTRFCAFRHGLY